MLWIGKPQRKSLLGIGDVGDWIMDLKRIKIGWCSLESSG
jgi:hypothetical protein